MKNFFCKIWVTILLFLSVYICDAQQIDTVTRNWFAFSQKVSVENLEGKKFKLTAAVKAYCANDIASASLWARVDKKNGENGFFDNMINRPIKKKQWQLYSIEGTIDSGAKELVIGGLCVYNGTFTFDEFKLLIQNNEKWENIAIENANFENIKNTAWETGIGRKQFVVKNFDNNIINKNAFGGNKCFEIKSCNIEMYGEDSKFGKYYETNKAKIYYEEYGKGEPLLLLHGNGQSIEAMNNQINFFKNKYRVIIPDCRGRGKSIDSDDELTYDIQASDMNNLLTYLKVDSANIIGWSDGGIIGLIMAKDYPIKVKKLIASGANVLQDTTAYFPKDLENFKQIMKDSTVPNNYKKLYNLMIKYPNISFAELGKIKCPTLIVAGDNDEIRIEHTVKIFQAITKGQLFIVPKTSHYVLSENVKVFNDAVFKFLLEK